jgi:hypothetical protein
LIVPFACTSPSPSTPRPFFSWSHFERWKSVESSTTIVRPSTVKATEGQRPDRPEIVPEKSTWRGAGGGLGVGDGIGEGPGVGVGVGVGVGAGNGLGAGVGVGAGRAAACDTV